MNRSILTVAGVVALSGVSAHAATFSFASDNNPNGPTFAGGIAPLNAMQFRDGGPLDLNNSISVSFLYDADDDGPGAAVAIASNFVFSGALRSYSTAAVGGGFRHDYLVSGSFQFLDASTGGLVFSATYNNALFTSFSPNANSWGQTATLQVSESVDPNMTFTAGAALGSISLPSSEDFAFTFTNLGTIASGSLVPISANGTPESTWRSEGSWSAHAIPGPAGLTVLALSMAGLVRRRR